MDDKISKPESATLTTTAYADEWTRLVNDGLSRGYPIVQCIRDADELFVARAKRCADGVTP